MPAIELTDEERRLLINMLTVEIEACKYPLRPRVERLKRIRAKLGGEEMATTAPHRSRRPLRPRRPQR